MIDIDSVTYRYPGEPFTAIETLTLSASEGLHLLEGPSGGGKSTVLRLCNGLVPQATGGRIWGRTRVLGRDAFSTPTRDLARQVGFLFQDCELQGVGLTVERDVAFGPENLGCSPQDIERRVAASLEACGVTGVRRRPLDLLSGGERQRVALAGVLAMETPVLCLDEPLAQIDTAGRAVIVSICRDLAHSGRAVLISEHRCETLRPHADTVHHMREGRLVPATSIPARDTHARAARAGGRITWTLNGVAAGPGVTPVIEGISLSGRAGQVVAVTGPNGSGKTTLLRTIAGFLPVMAGSRELDDRRCAYLPQNPAQLLWRATVRAEIEATLGPGDDAITATLHDYGLSDVAGRYPADLSTGQRQRAAFAAVLAGNPDVALLDEPTRGMDSRARASLVTAINRLAASGASVVIATHDSELVDDVADVVFDLETCRTRELEARQSVGAL